MKQAQIEAPQIDFAALRMAMPQVVEPSDAMAAFKAAYEKAQSAKLEREMKALGLDTAGQPLRNSLLQDATYQPRMPINATGIRAGSDSIYKPTSSPSIYTDDSLREPDITPDVNTDDLTGNSDASLSRISAVYKDLPSPSNRQKNQSSYDSITEEAIKRGDYETASKSSAKNPSVVDSEYQRIESDRKAREKAISDKYNVRFQELLKRGLTPSSKEYLDLRESYYKELNPRYHSKPPLRTPIPHNAA